MTPFSLPLSHQDWTKIRSQLLATQALQRMAVFHTQTEPFSFSYINMFQRSHFTTGRSQFNQSTVGVTEKTWWHLADFFSEESSFLSHGFGFFDEPQTQCQTWLQTKWKGGNCPPKNVETYAEKTCRGDEKTRSGLCRAFTSSPKAWRVGLDPQLQHVGISKAKMLQHVSNFQGMAFGRTACGLRTAELGSYPLPKNTEQLSFLGYLSISPKHILYMCFHWLRLWAFTLLQRSAVVFGEEFVKEKLRALWLV